MSPSDSFRLVQPIDLQHRFLVFRYLKLEIHGMFVRSLDGLSFIYEHGDMNVTRMNGGFQIFPDCHSEGTAKTGIFRISDSSF